MLFVALTENAATASPCPSSSFAVDDGVYATVTEAPSATADAAVRASFPLLTSALVTAEPLIVNAATAVVDSDDSDRLNET